MPKNLVSRALPLFGALVLCALFTESAWAQDSTTQVPPSLLDTMSATWDLWADWLRAQAVWLVVLAGLAIAYGFGVAVFFITHAGGSFAPKAARSGLWVAAVVAFMILTPILIPATAPLWWWIAALVAMFFLVGIASSQGGQRKAAS